MLDKNTPNEQINELLEAKPKGAVAWLWSDGSTKDTLGYLAPEVWSDGNDR